jgi:hypothetical protein
MGETGVPLEERFPYAELNGLQARGNLEIPTLESRGSLDEVWDYFVKMLRPTFRSAFS